MKIIKKLIFLTIIIIITLILLILIINRKNVEYNYEEDGSGEPTIEEIKNKEKEFELVNNRNKYYAIKGIVEEYTYNLYCINQPLSNSEYSSTAITTARKEEAMLKIKSVLAKEYVEKYSINDEGIKNIAKDYIKGTVQINNMYIYDTYELIETYIIDAQFTETSQQLKVLIVLDLENSTYEIYPNNYLIDNKLDNMSKEDFNKFNTSKIEKNDYNKFYHVDISDITILNDYTQLFKQVLLYNPELAYEYLDEEYRNIKFGSLDNFKQYVNENKERISSIVLDKYQKTINDDYTQYVCIDTNGNYYIFRETAVMQYSLLLDTYTIDIPEFTEKYNKVDNETKVGMNIEKVLLALNNKDYNYIYGKLASGFKNNYFPTVDSLKQYMQTNLFEKNTVEYDTVDNEGINYMFDIKFNNAQDTAANPVSKRIIMQLKEGTDFVFSFNVD